MNPIPWWVPLVSVLLGVVLAFGAAEVRERLTRRRARRGHFEALAAEIRMCGAIARGYLTGGVRSPAYRMPLIGHERSLPSVLSDGILDPNESEAIIRFYINAKAFNLCLDYCHDALLEKRREEDPDRLEKEVGRARLKAEKLAPGIGRATHYDNALRIISTKLPLGSLQQLSFNVDEPE